MAKSNYTIDKSKRDRKGQAIVKLTYTDGERLGEVKTLLNPDQRGRKYAKDLKNGKDTFTDKELRDTQKAFRSGYLKSREDSARVFCAKNGTKYQKGSRKGSVTAKSDKTCKSK